MTNLQIEEKIKLRLYEKDQNEFQKFVIEIYRIKYPNITYIKPQGRKGDGGNDGYVSGELVLQCYAPENVNANETNKKIKDDFEKAKKAGWKFTEWHFVINDKFKGVPKEVHSYIDQLQEINNDVKIQLIDSEILKNNLINYSKNESSIFKVYCLLNFEVDINKFDNLDLLIKAINFIAEDSAILKSNQTECFLNFSLQEFKPDGQKKLKINIQDESFLKMFGAYIEKAIEIIETYKNEIDNFEKVGKIIKEKFTDFNKGFTAEASLQKTFDYFNKKNEQSDQNFQFALWIVIAYFFDICDIGDDPNGNGK